VPASIGAGSQGSAGAPVPDASKSQLAAPVPGEITAPIVVPNTLWQAANPLAYDGGRPAEITHLREFGLTDVGRRDDARWGALEVVPTKADYVLDLIRANSLWPLLSGLACCAFEMMSGATSKNDMDRWGMFPFRASPRQADVLIVAGTLTTKMAGPLVRLWEQMPEPKWCVALGDCTARAAATSAATHGPGHRPGHARGRLHPRLPAPPGRPHLRHDAAPAARQGPPRHWPEREIGPTVPDKI
jgi:hypothetical protein